MKQSISSSLKLVCTYFVVCILGSLIGGVIFMVYNLCSNMVAGQNSISFSGELFFHGILFFAPILIIFSGMFLVLYMIRHSINNIPALAVYVFLLLISWGIFIPLGNNYILILESYESEYIDRQSLSTGYFRDYENDSFYFSQIDDEGVASGVVIDSTANKAYTFKDLKPTIQSENNFTDNLVQTNVATPILLTTLVSKYKIFYEISKKASLSGVRTWLCFATIGFALISVVALKRLSHYRLINALVVLYVSFIIVGFNIVGYQSSFITPLVSGANDFLCKIPGIRSLENPFVVLCNIITTVLFGIIGVVKFFTEEDNPMFASGFSSYDDEGDNDL